MSDKPDLATKRRVMISKLQPTHVALVHDDCHFAADDDFAPLPYEIRIIDSSPDALRIEEPFPDTALQNAVGWV